MTADTRPLRAEEWLSEIGRKIDTLAERAGVDEVAGDLRTWRSRLDRLRVQAALGTMEARDRVVPLIDRADVALRELHRLFDELGEDVVDEDGLTEEVRRAMANLQKEIDAADELH